MIPKFRAWDKKEKKMCNVAAIWFSSDSVILERGVFVYERKLDEVELMQATGVWSICDDGITEIYEGDIIKNAYDEIYTVKWFDAAFYLEEKYNGGFDYHELHLEDNKKVIGNIYENSELLEDN